MTLREARTYGTRDKKIHLLRKRIQELQAEKVTIYERAKKRRARDGKIQSAGV